MERSVLPWLTMKGQIKVILLKNRVSVRDSAMVTIKRSLELIGRGSDGVVRLTLGDPEKSDQSHLLENTVSVRDSAILFGEHL